MPDSPSDHYGPIAEEALWGTALKLATRVSEIVDASRQPVPMDQIRQMAQTMANSFYDEHHYLEYNQWFTTMKFPDGSYITWGEED